MRQRLYLLLVSLLCAVRSNKVLNTGALEEGTTKKLHRLFKGDNQYIYPKFNLWQKENSKTFFY